MNIRCTPSCLHGTIKANTNDSINLFLLCAGALSKEGVTLTDFKASENTVKLLDILKIMGARVKTDANSVTVSKNKLYGMTANVTGLEPEFFICCALASIFDKGFTQITGLRKIRKETVALAVENLSKIRVACSFDDDDELIVWGGNEIVGGTVDAKGNAPFSLALAVISCESRLPIDILNTGGMQNEITDFIDCVNSLHGKIEILK